jgi:perosamine synthetase
MAYRIPLIEPYLGKKSKTFVDECFDTKWISSRGHFIKDFETAYAQFIGTRHAVAVSNGTTALHLSLLGYGIGEGDEVIVPDLTFAATINAVLHARATPVIVDVDPQTWNISVDGIKSVLSKRSKAILPVHLYGYPAAMQEIMKVASENGLIVIEDAAEAHGAAYRNKIVGSIGQCGTFSFYGNKIITTGEGGMITLNDDSVDEKMRLLRDHGMNKNDRYHYDIVGYNYRMTNPQAALGLAQLAEVKDILAYRDKIARWYVERLQSVPGVELRKEGSDVRSVNWLFTCLVNDRDSIMKELEALHIESRPMFIPLHEMDIYRDYRTSSYRNSTAISLRGISLPTYFDMPELYVDEVCSVIRNHAAR